MWLSVVPLPLLLKTVLLYCQLVMPLCLLLTTLLPSITVVLSRRLAARLEYWYLPTVTTQCHGAAVGRLSRLHDYLFWMFSFLYLN